MRSVIASATQCHPLLNLQHTIHTKALFPRWSSLGLHSLLTVILRDSVTHALWITCTHHLCFCHFWLSPAAHPLHGATLQFNWKQVVVQKAITHLGCASLLWDTGRLLLSGLTDLSKRVWAQEAQSLQGRFFLRQILGHVSRRDAGIRSIETGLFPST